MKKAELLSALDESHETYLELLQGLSEEKLTQPNTVGEWSFKDVLVHLSMWEAEAIKMLFQARQGLTPKNVFTSATNEDEQNKVWVEASRNRPLQRVMEDFTIIREETIRRVDTFTDKELTDSVRFPWLYGSTIAKLIQEFVLDHEKMHIRDLQNWLDRQVKPEKPSD